MKYLHEDLIDIFNDDRVTVSVPGPLTVTPKVASLSRTKALGLELKIVSSGWSDHRGPDIPAGTLFQSEEVIEFVSPSGASYSAKGAILCNVNSRHSAAQGEETTHVYSLHEMEMLWPGPEPASYVIEWVGNLSAAFMGTSNMEVDGVETETIRIGEAGEAISIRRASSSRGGSKVIHLRAGGFDIYLVNDKDSGERRHFRNGFIAFKDCPNLETRNRIRDCISFILGLPVVLYGYTEYASDGRPIFMSSVEAFAFGGGAFRLTAQPPYPINVAQYRNIMDEEAFGLAVDALYTNYADLRFDELSWTYWYGACAAVTMAAVYFGGLIEQLQRTSKKIVGHSDTTLVQGDIWDGIAPHLLAAIAQQDLDPAARRILLNKISALNQLPQSVALERLLTKLGLQISGAEKSAWRQRNSAAHGSMRTDHNAVILNTKLLRLMFHRMIAAVTGCNSRYIDYYNLDFPIRALREAVPARHPS